MAYQPNRYSPHDTPPKRAVQLAAMDERLGEVEEEVDEVAEQVNQLALVSGGGAYDPGDLMVYLQNGLT